MVWQKGESGNLAGRPIGSKNNNMVLAKDKVAAFVNGYIGSDEFKRDFASLDPDKKMRVATDLLGYVAPRLQATQVDSVVTSRKAFSDELIKLTGEVDLKKQIKDNSEVIN